VALSLSLSLCSSLGVPLSRIIRICFFAKVMKILYIVDFGYMLLVGTPT
jgi:hypothetical protein